MVVGHRPDLFGYWGHGRAGKARKSSAVTAPSGEPGSTDFFGVPVGTEASAAAQTAAAFRGREVSYWR